MQGYYILTAAVKLRVISQLMLALVKYINLKRERTLLIGTLSSI